MEIFQHQLSERLLHQSAEINQLLETDSKLGWLVKRWLVLCLKTSYHPHLTMLMLNCLDFFVSNTHTIEYLIRKGEHNIICF